MAKTVLKRLGTRLRREERRNADYQHQLAALQRRWRMACQARETVWELDALKKK